MPKRTTKYKKAPGAPRRFTSAYMFFSTQKHKQIREELDSRGEPTTTPMVAKLVSAAWKSLTDEEREPWNQMATRDKARFKYEMANYKGPLKVLKGTRQKKDPKAPKRPISAFLAYSQDKREEILALDPTLRTTEVAIVLSQLWKEEPHAVRQHYLHQTGLLREKYKQEMAVHKQEVAQEKKTKENEAIVAATEEVLTDVMGLCDVDAVESDLLLDNDEDIDMVEDEPKPETEPEPAVEQETIETDDDNDNGDGEVVVEPPQKHVLEPEAVETTTAETTSQRVEAVVEEEEDAFGCDDWEPLPFEDNGTVDGNTTPTDVDVDVAFPRENLQSPPELLTKDQKNYFWQGSLPTSFVTGVSPLCGTHTAAGAKMAALVTPEQSPRDVRMPQQQQLERNRVSLPLSLPTPVEASRVEGSNRNNANINNNQNYISSGASAFSMTSPSPLPSPLPSPSSMPPHMLMNPWFLQNLPPPPQLDCMAPIPMYAPPRGFMAPQHQHGHSQSMPQALPVPLPPAFGRCYSMPQAPPVFVRRYSMAPAPRSPPATMRPSMPAPAAPPAAIGRRQSIPPAPPSLPAVLKRSKSMPPVTLAPRAALGRSKGVAPVPPPPPMTPVPSTAPAPHGRTQCMTPVPVAPPAPRAAPESPAPSTTTTTTDKTEDFPVLEDVEDSSCTASTGNAPAPWMVAWSSGAMGDDLNII